MFPPWWLTWKNGKSRLSRRRPRSAARSRIYRPHLEALEDRWVLSTFTVVLTTNWRLGGSSGQEVTATSGDLRYCVSQANAAHNAVADTISFAPAVFAAPQTITLNNALGALVLNDSLPETIQGPAADTVTVSGGDKVGVFQIYILVICCCCCC